MYTCPLGLHMAKLYWRVKKDGKWTWTPAHVPLIVEEGFVVVPPHPPGCWCGGDSCLQQDREEE